MTAWTCDQLRAEITRVGKFIAIAQQRAISAPWMQVLQDLQERHDWLTGMLLARYDELRKPVVDFRRWKMGDAA